ncbi:acyltransferase domain-containing protein [Acutalibacter sp. JLR.KK004]|uniref:acyltransferase domain-containing protein n=1 Tax=Acutalibacter sp. JLR.KK004 TaxID=3112622 RepID=UPI002FEEFDA0
MKNLDLDFMALLMDKTGFPQEAKASLLESARAMEDKGQAPALLEALDAFYQNGFSTKDAQPAIDAMAEKAALSPYTVWMLFLMQGAKRAKGDYEKKGVGEDIFWATFSDLRYKALECKENHDVWGTFVAFWYPIFYSCDIVKLGRLEYENRAYDGPAYEKNGFSLRPGDKVKSIHIPSSGEPFNREARMDSYRQAYAFFKEELGGGPLFCVCHSWLLYPEYKKILKPGSNIVDFQSDFDIIKADAEEFGDAWRVFGPQHTLPAADLPEDTSMRRAFKQHLLSGGTTGEGLGILIFDGEEIVNV